MFLPIGDSPNPPGTPWMTYSLIAVNVVVYVVLLPAGFQAPDIDDPALRNYLDVTEDQTDQDFLAIAVNVRVVPDEYLVVDEPFKVFYGFRIDFLVVGVNARFQVYLGLNDVKEAQVVAGGQFSGFFRVYNVVGGRSHLGGVFFFRSDPFERPYGYH